MLFISKYFEPFILLKPMKIKIEQIKICIKLKNIALLKFNSNNANWYIATSIVEFNGLPPNTITIAKLRKHSENIIEKTENKFCFIIGISNLIIFPKKVKFKELDIS